MFYFFPSLFAPVCMNFYYLISAEMFPQEPFISFWCWVRTQYTPQICTWWEKARDDFIRHILMCLLWNAIQVKWMEGNEMKGRHHIMCLNQGYDLIVCSLYTSIYWLIKFLAFLIQLVCRCITDLPLPFCITDKFSSLFNYKCLFGSYLA